VDRSIVSVADHPAVELDAVGATLTLHAVTDVNLTELIVGKDDNEEGEGRNTEVGKGNSTGSQHKVEEGNVGEESGKSSLEEETEDHVTVDHTLLRDGEVTGLANEQVGPLHNDNGDEVTTLSVSKSLGGVADLDASDGGDSEEGGDVGGVGVPAARGPGGSGAVNVEESPVNLLVLETVPVEGDAAGLVIVARLSGSALGVGVVDNLGAALRGVLPVGVTVVVEVGVVHVRVLGQDTALKSKEERGGGSHTVVVQHVEVGEETGRGLHDTDLEVSEGNQLSVHQVITLGVTGVTFHDIELGVLISEGDSGNHIGTEINTENEHGGKRQRNLEQDEEDERKDLRNVG